MGAGPAGATAALNLAAFREVTMIDSREAPLRAPGESLVPAARRLLNDMGLMESFQGLGFSEYHGNSSIWGSCQIQETSFARDIDGSGWHLDRVRFESWLREQAVRRGTRLLAPMNLTGIRREGSRFIVELRSYKSFLSVATDFVIDAGGRTALAARSLGALRQMDLPLICRAVYGTSASKGPYAGINFIEAVEDGWWYTTPLPDGQRVLAFHTDKDLPASAVRSPNGLLHHAEKTTELRNVLTAMNFSPESKSSGCLASGSVLAPCCGPGWLASGDAALTFDPLSSQGLLNSLFMGLAAAEATDSYLSGKSFAMAEYQSSATRIREAYRKALSLCYAQEGRWRRAPFWLRRIARKTATPHDDESS